MREITFKCDIKARQRLINKTKEVYFLSLLRLVFQSPLIALLPVCSKDTKQKEKGGTVEMTQRRDWEKIYDLLTKPAARQARENYR